MSLLTAMNYWLSLNQNLVRKRNIALQEEAFAQKWNWSVWSIIDQHLPVRLFSGALQDLDRGIVIGSRTYGKGLVQETFELKDGSQIRLTVSRYYIPSGRSIQKPYNEEGYTELDSTDLSKQGKKYSTKNGREVKSEGGVSPDIVIEGETYTDYLNVTDYAASLIDRHVEEWSLMTPKDWSEHKTVDAIIRTSLKDSSTYFDEVKNRLVYQIYGIEEAYAKNVKSDKTILRAIKAFDEMSTLLNP